MGTAVVSSQANAAFLRGCAVSSPDEWDGQEHALRKLDPGSWSLVAELAKQQGLVGLLSRNLAWARDKTGIAVPILDELDALRQGQLVQHLARKAAARRVAEALGRRGIPFVIFKGLVLAEEIYGDLSLRGFRDCDMLVPSDRLDEAYGTVLELGYALVQFDHVRDYVGLGAHAAAMVHRDGTGIDLHWSIAPDILDANRIAIIWAQCRPGVNGASLPGLRMSPELTLIHLAKHFHSHQYTSIKPLVDFYVTCRRLGESVDARRLEETARALDLLPIIDIAVALCERSFLPGATRPILGVRMPGLPSRLASRIVTDDLMLNPGHFSRIGNWLRYLLAAGSIGTFLRGLREVLVPGRLVLAQFFNQPHQPGHYPRYYWRQFVKVVTLASK